ncbi:MAG: polysaccharide deacetylase family protein [Deltaproteobacteria bacterium]|nr:polysaccharide deacetylase family protein [Deltaproteobacteria bacterium]
MKKLLNAAIVLFLFFAAQGVSGQEFNAVVLMYHKFGEDRYPSTSVSLEQFHAHLEYLATNGFHVLPLEEIVTAYRNKSPLPDKCISFTVDDAYLSVYTQAFPRMKKRNWPFTVFVSSDAVDKGYRSYMTWDQMREMRKNGVSFANHTASHDYLVRRKQGESAQAHIDRVRNDIEHCQRRLLEELGDAPMLFAYPYGEYNTEIARLVESMGFTAFGQHSGAVGPFCNPATLPRFPVNQHYGDLKSLKTKFYSLALPVSSIVPFEPVTAERRPVLKVYLEETDARLNELACFVSGQGRTMPKWIESNRRFSIQAAKDLGNGRNRYTCTAPNRERSRYYWFSHQFVITPPVD